MSDKVEVNQSSMGVASVLTIIFVLCKLFGVINWSWWLVFSPLIVSAAIGLLVIGELLLAILGFVIYEARK